MTNLTLDQLIFGNGHGFASPHSDQRFYWLGGELYTFLPGLGAQLSSVQWTHPRPQERRHLSGYEFAPFNSRRSRWGRVWVSWAWTQLPSDLNAAQAALREMDEQLACSTRNSRGVICR